MDEEDWYPEYDLRLACKGNSKKRRLGDSWNIFETESFLRGLYYKLPLYWDVDLHNVLSATMGTSVVREIVMGYVDVAVFSPFGILSKPDDTGGKMWTFGAQKYHTRVAHERGEVYMGVVVYVAQLPDQPVYNL